MAPTCTISPANPLVHRGDDVAGAFHERHAGGLAVEARAERADDSVGAPDGIVDHDGVTKLADHDVTSSLQVLEAFAGLRT